MKIRIAYLVLAAVLSFLFGANGHAQERFDYKVRNDFFAGFGGDPEAMARAMKTTESVLVADPSHAEALVWHGAGVYFQGGQAFQKGDPQTGMQLAQKGIAEMDKAVAIAPNSVAVRIPRGAVLLSATRFQQGPHVAALVQRALDDYQRAFDIQQSTLAELPTHPKGELFFGLADGYNRTGDKEKAKSFYERAVKELPGTPYEKFAKEWLANGTLAPQKAGCLGCHTGK